MINSKISGVYNVGTEMKSVYQLALEERSIKPIISQIMPKNTSMEYIKDEKFFGFSIAIPAYGYNGKVKIS
jgi:hypothetical protein